MPHTRPKIQRQNTGFLKKAQKIAILKNLEDLDFKKSSLCLFGIQMRRKILEIPTTFLFCCNKKCDNQMNKLVPISSRKGEI